MADYKQVAEQVLAAVGGKENISSVTHCMTRLRFVLKDQSIPEKNGITKIKGVVGVNIAGGQYQVIIGNSVGSVYREMVALGVQADAQGAGNTAKQKVNPVSAALEFIAGCMTPLIPVLLAGALFRCVNSLCGPELLGLYRVLEHCKKCP